VAAARSLFSVVMKRVRAPGSVALEICKSSSIVLGNKPVMADAVTGISPPGGPVKIYVNVGSSRLP
jgi:hypothetical protein